MAAIVEQRCWRCNKYLCRVYALRGRVEIDCTRCKARNVFIGSDVDRLISEQVTASTRPDGYEPVTERPSHLRPTPRPSLSPDELVRLMEERWRHFTAKRARERAEVASGLRFDVFLRDGFRCRYCGLSVDHGAILHADHVIAQSKGGATTLDNLVTACMDCNLGKSNKMLPVNRLY